MIRELRPCHNGDAAGRHGLGGVRGLVRSLRHLGARVSARGGILGPLAPAESEECWSGAVRQNWQNYTTMPYHIRLHTTKQLALMGPVAAVPHGCSGEPTRGLFRRKRRMLK